MEENESIRIEDSILNSVKQQLGLSPEQKEFDPNILMNINAAIQTLMQMGVGSQDNMFFVNDETQTYDDYLGSGSKEMPMIKLYLFYKTKMGFDPPMSSIVAEAIKTQMAEIEWRLCAQVDPMDTFRQGGEIS